MSRSPYTLFYDKMRTLVTENKDGIINLPVLSRSDCALVLGFICTEFGLDKDQLIAEWNHLEENKVC